MKSNDDAKRKLRTDVESLVSECRQLWLAAFGLHRCVACAVQDIEEKLELHGQEDLEMEGLDCMAYCRDAFWAAKKVEAKELVGVGGMANLVVRKPGVKSSVSLQLSVSSKMVAVWNAALAFSGCAECARVLIRREILSAAAATRAFIPAGGGREGFRRACKRCQPDVKGLV